MIVKTTLKIEFERDRVLADGNGTVFRRNIFHGELANVGNDSLATFDRIKWKLTACGQGGSAGPISRHPLQKPLNGAVLQGQIEKIDVTKSQRTHRHLPSGAKLPFMENSFALFITCT